MNLNMVKLAIQGLEVQRSALQAMQAGAADALVGMLLEGFRLDELVKPSWRRCETLGSRLLEASGCLLEASVGLKPPFGIYWKRNCNLRFM